MKPGVVDWEYIFGELGVRWFHTGGIFATLSDSTHEVALEAVEVARRHGTIVSFDLNYRASIWSEVANRESMQASNRKIASFVDVMMGNEDGFAKCLGYESGPRNPEGGDIPGFKRLIEHTIGDFPNFKVVATTLRNTKTALINDWGAICWANGGFYEAVYRENLDIFDRVGGGDGFAAGLIYGLMATENPEKAVNYGAVHGALAMTTPGDTSMATVREVEEIMNGGNARVQR